MSTAAGDATPATTEPAAEGSHAPSATGVLVVTSLASLVVNANTSAVAILLPAISKDLHATLATLQWAVTGYSLVGAACVVTAGALGDVFGRRRVFVSGLVLFVASCALIALAPNALVLIAGRAIQGAAGATLLACGLSLLTVASSGRSRLRSVSYWGAASAVGSAAGPLLGGVLVNSVGWQALFWVDAALAALLVPLAVRVVGESSDPARSRSIDWPGTALVAIALAPVILGTSKGADWGWTSPATLGCFAVAVFGAIGFVLVERTSRSPLVDLHLLRNRVLVGATLGLLVSAGTINGLMFVTSIYLQSPATLHMTPLQAGWATLPATVGVLALTPGIPSLVTKLGAGTVVGLGFVLSALGFAAFVPITSTWGYVAFVLPMLLMTIGVSLSNNPCSSAATSSVEAGQVGQASGISNMARYAGGSVVTAIVATVYSTVSERRGASGSDQGAALAAGFSASALTLAIISACGIPLVVLIGRHRPRRKPDRVDTAIAAAGISHTVPRPADATG